MMASFKESIKNEPTLKLIFFGGLLVQIIFSLTSTGFHHPDQHFQLIEFSTAQSGEPSGAPFVWEWDHHVRQTIQVYLYTGYHQLINFLGIHNPYTEMTILRLILGISIFLVFNLFTFYFLQNGKRQILYIALIILNFSWFLPYSRTLYSSEIISSVFFFGTVLLYLQKKNLHQKFGFLFLIGLLFAITFYLRFQVALLIAGFFIWIIWVTKKYRQVLPMILGFALGCVINTTLDCIYYHEFVITPYAYFYINTIGGRATATGTESVFFYLGILLAFITVPFVNLLLFYYGFKAYAKKYRNLVFICVALFLVGHSIIPHKEDRFLFPVFNVMPIILALGMEDFISYYQRCKKWIKLFFRILIGFSLVLNAALLFLFVITPYSQSVHFTKKLYDKFESKNIPVKIYCYQRTPFETPAKSPLIFYKRAFKDAEIIRVNDRDSLKLITGENAYIATTFDKIKKDRHLIDSLHLKPQLYSSTILWGINEFLNTRKVNTINDIWVLYKKD